jgi:hypothetical protein
MVLSTTAWLCAESGQPIRPLLIHSTSLQLLNWVSWRGNRFRDLIMYFLFSDPNDDIAHRTSAIFPKWIGSEVISLGGTEQPNGSTRHLLIPSMLCTIYSISVRKTISKSVSDNPTEINIYLDLPYMYLWRFITGSHTRYTMDNRIANKIKQFS